MTAAEARSLIEKFLCQDVLATFSGDVEMVVKWRMKGVHISPKALTREIADYQAQLSVIHKEVEEMSDDDAMTFCTFLGRCFGPTWWEALSDPSL